MEIEMECKKHPSNKTLLFCVNCKAVICEICAEEEHFGHNKLPLDVSEEYSRLSFLQREIVESEKKLKMIKEQHTIISNDIEKQKRSVLNTKEKKEAELEKSIYIQCLKFSKHAMQLESKIPLVTDMYKTLGIYDCSAMIRDFHKNKQLFRETIKIKGEGQYCGFWNATINSRDGRGVMVYLLNMDIF